MEIAEHGVPAVICVMLLQSKFALGDVSTLNELSVTAHLFLQVTAVGVELIEAVPEQFTSRIPSLDIVIDPQVMPPQFCRLTALPLESWQPPPSWAW